MPVRSSYAVAGLIALSSLIACGDDAPDPAASSRSEVVASEAADVVFSCTQADGEPARLRFDESTATLSYEHGARRRSGPLFGRPIDTLGQDLLLFYTSTAFFVLRDHADLTAVMLDADNVRTDDRTACDPTRDAVWFNDALYGRMLDRVNAAAAQEVPFGSACRSSDPNVHVSSRTVLSILPGLDGRSVQLFGRLVDNAAYDIAIFDVRSVSTEGTRTTLRGTGWAKLRPEPPATGRQMDALVDEVVVDEDASGKFLTFPGKPAEPYASVRCEAFDTAGVEALLQR